MKIKTLDKILDACLWVTFGLCVLASWFIAKAITAPDYEPVDTDYTMEYEFQTDDGERVNSTYQLAWEHSNVYVNPIPVVYDPKYKRVEHFKEEYLEKYKAMMPKSQFTGLHRHIFWVWFIGLSVICGIILLMYGSDWRDWILYYRIKNSNASFLDMSFFLYNTDRNEKVRDKVRALVPRAAEKYVRNNRAVLSRKFTPNFYNVLIKWLETIATTGSTTIPYQYVFENKLSQMQSYLDYLLSYWDKQRGVNPHADSNIEKIKSLKTRSYVTIPPLREQNSYRTSVTEQLKKMFADVMGAEVFTFTASGVFDSMLYASKAGSRVVVRTTLLNDANNTFTWTGSKCSGMVFPGIRIFFSVDIVKNGTPTRIWEGDLPPVCNYTASDDDFEVEKLYNNMVVHTIDTFVSNMKKS